MAYRQRDLLEDFLNDVTPVQTGPTTTGITSLGSQNMGGLGRLPPSQPQYSYAPNPAPTSYGAPPPTSSSSSSISLDTFDPFDDNAFNFRSTPSQPPNPATNPFYLGNAEPKKTAPTSPSSPAPMMTPSFVPSPTPSFAPASTPSYTPTPTPAPVPSPSKDTKPNKYGSSYGSRSNPAPATSQNGGPSFFNVPSPQTTPTPAPGGYPPPLSSSNFSSPQPHQPQQYSQPPPQQQQHQQQSFGAPLQQPQQYGAPMQQSQQYGAPMQQPMGGYGGAPMTQSQQYGAPQQPQQYGAPMAQSQQYGAPQPQRGPSGPTGFGAAPAPTPTPGYGAPAQQHYGAPNGAPVAAAPWADEDDPFSPPPQQTPSSWQPGQGQQGGGYGVSAPPSAPTSMGNSMPPASASAKKGESGITSFFKGLFSDAPTPQVRKPKGRMPLSITFAQFQVSANQIQALFNTWVQDRWFAPVGFLQKIHLGAVERELVPFWQFNASTMTTTHGKCCYVTHEKTETGTTKAVETWQDGKASHNSSFKDILLPGWDFEDERKELLLELKGWDASQAKQNCQAVQIPNNIHPHPAVEWTDVWPQHTENVIKKQELAQGKKELQTQARCTRVRDLKSIVTYTSLSKRLIFFPVYTFTYTYEEKLYRVYVHGQTGQMVGARPYGLGALGESAKSGLDSFTDFISDKMKDVKK